jgi:hypothetical protein
MIVTPRHPRPPPPDPLGPRIKSEGRGPRVTEAYDVA